MISINGNSFASSVAKYYEEDTSFESAQTSIHVQIILKSAKERGREIATLARLDPATPWVVLNAELNKVLGLGDAGPLISLQTAAGHMEGTLERYPIMLAALEGQSLEIDATLFVCSEWQRGNFLGYTGLLQRIRFAIDPVSQLFYFDSSAG